MIVGDEPIAGFYAMRRVPGGPLVAVRIWRDKTGWIAEVDGVIALHLDRVWPWCARLPISEAEFHYMKERAAWARAKSPDHPSARPHRRVNLRRIPPIKP